MLGYVIHAHPVVPFDVDPSVYRKVVLGADARMAMFDSSLEMYLSLSVDMVRRGVMLVLGPGELTSSRQSPGEVMLCRRERVFQTVGRGLVVFDAMVFCQPMVIILFGGEMVGKRGWEAS